MRWIFCIFTCVSMSAAGFVACGVPTEKYDADTVALQDEINRAQEALGEAQQALGQLRDQGQELESRLSQCGAKKLQQTSNLKAIQEKEAKTYNERQEESRGEASGEAFVGVKEDGTQIKEKKGTITIITKPSNARVWFDGNEISAASPIILEEIDAGVHHIKAVISGLLRGDAIVEKNIEFHPGRGPQQIVINLKNEVQKMSIQWNEKEKAQKKLEKKEWEQAESANDYNTYLQFYKKYPHSDFMEKFTGTFSKTYARWDGKKWVDTFKIKEFPGLDFELPFPQASNNTVADISGGVLTLFTIDGEKITIDDTKRDYSKSPFLQKRVHVLGIKNENKIVVIILALASTSETHNSGSSERDPQH